MAIALMMALAMAVAGCGGDDEQTSSAPATTAPAQTATAETESVPTETEQESPSTESVPAETAPEDQPGGAGDEEPARTLALFTAKDGRITPRVVRVPAFISIEVQLRSADGAKYGLRFGGTTVSVGDGLSSVSTTIDGLRPGKAIVGTPEGPGNRVRIEATAEPGP